MSLRNDPQRESVVDEDSSKQTTIFIQNQLAERLDEHDVKHKEYDDQFSALQKHFARMEASLRDTDVIVLEARKQNEQLSSQMIDLEEKVKTCNGSVAYAGSVAENTKSAFEKDVVKRNEERDGTHIRLHVCEQSIAAIDSPHSTLTTAGLEITRINKEMVAVQDQVRACEEKLAVITSQPPATRGHPHQQTAGRPRPEDYLPTALYTTCDQSIQVDGSEKEHSATSPAPHSALFVETYEQGHLDATTHSPNGGRSKRSTPLRKDDKGYHALPSPSRSACGVYDNKSSNIQYGGELESYPRNQAIFSEVESVSPSDSISHCEDHYENLRTRSHPRNVADPTSVWRSPYLQESQLSRAGHGMRLDHPYDRSARQVARVQPSPMSKRDSADLVPSISTFSGSTACEDHKTLDIKTPAMTQLCRSQRPALSGELPLGDRARRDRDGFVSRHDSQIRPPNIEQQHPGHNLYRTDVPYSAVEYTHSHPSQANPNLKTPILPVQPHARSHPSDELPSTLHALGIISAPRLINTQLNVFGTEGPNAEPRRRFKRRINGTDDIIRLRANERGR